MSNSANFERGLQLYELGRYKEAIPFFKNELTQNIDNIDAKFYLAYTYFYNDDIEKAKSLAYELRSMAPNFAPIYQLLAQICLNNDDTKEATSYIEEAISLDPYNDDYFAVKSYILINQKEFEKALEFANKGLEINAKNLSCLNARATCLTKLNKTNEANETIENLLSDNPENSFSHANVGWNLLENGNHKKALEHFKESLKLDPNDEFAREGMLTAIKAKNIFYRTYLKYVFWIGKQSGRNQIISIIAIYLIYRFSVKFLTFSGLSILAVPLVVIYLLFALGTWIMEPISNMILLMDKHGKYLLNKNDRLSGLTMFLLLLLAITSYSINLIFHNNFLIVLSLSFLVAVLPLSKAPLSTKRLSKIFDFSYGIIILIAPAISYVMGVNFGDVITLLIILFVAYTWLASLIFK